MPYAKRRLPRPKRPVRGLFGFGDFSDESPCAAIPPGDPYRRPGNYCATADGGYTTFNADGTTYDGTVASRSVWDKIGSAISGALNQGAVISPGYPTVVAPGMSTTTMVALAGGAVLLVTLLSRRR